MNAAPFLRLAGAPALWLRFEKLEDGGNVALADRGHRLPINIDQAIEQRGCDADLIGELLSRLQIACEAGSRTLLRRQPSLSHPRRPNPELGRAAASGSNGLDQKFGVDVSSKADGHRLSRAGDVQPYEQIIDELDLGRGPEWTEIKHVIGECAD